MRLTIENRILHVKLGSIIIDYIEIYKIEEVSRRRHEPTKYGLSEKYISIKGKMILNLC